GVFDWLGDRRADLRHVWRSPRSRTHANVHHFALFDLYGLERSLSGHLGLLLVPIPDGPRGRRRLCRRGGTPGPDDAVERPALCARFHASVLRDWQLYRSGLVHRAGITPTRWASGIPEARRP